MKSIASLASLGLAAALFPATVGAQAVATPTQAQQEQTAFVLRLEGLTTANQAAIQAEISKVPTVAAATVDAATGKVSIMTAPGVQLDTDAAKAAIAHAGLKVAQVDIPAWAAETVWVVTAQGGS